MKTKSASYKVNLITLGCSKNTVDSENIMTQLRGGDIQVETDVESSDAECVIINTCGFIEVAKQESINLILEYADQRKKGKIEKLYVTGCLSHRYREDLEKEIPEVDAYFGTMDLPALLAKFQINYRSELLGDRKIMGPPHYAYLKISEGCNRKCSFCAIPLMRGGHKSREMGEIVDEARRLVRMGVKEILLVAQELTYYGLDLYKSRKLPELLEALAQIKGLGWIRLHYAYPSKFPEKVFEVMARYPNICNYLDLPLQHANDEVLANMNRQISRRETEDLVARARKLVPGIALRTTLMVGFPGENQNHFEELCEFVTKMKFDRLGIFEYSHEDDTSATQWNDDVPMRIKSERARVLMELQKNISAAINKGKRGKTMKVLVDKKEGDFFYARTEYDSPEVDNEVIVDACKYFLRVGDFANVFIEDSTEYDLYGIPV